MEKDLNIARNQTERLMIFQIAEFKKIISKKMKDKKSSKDLFFIKTKLKKKKNSKEVSVSEQKKTSKNNSENSLVLLQNIKNSAQNKLFKMNLSKELKFLWIFWQELSDTFEDYETEKTLQICDKFKTDFLKLVIFFFYCFIFFLIF